MSLREAYIGVRIMETNDNYSRADASVSSLLETRTSRSNQYFDGDEYVWERIFYNPESVWGLTFYFNPVTMSEWVARVPGLYWRPGAKDMRKLSPAAIEPAENHWTQYTPWGKSQLVALGGIGTLRLPPANDGTRLVTLTTTLNISAGVPALVTPAVWEKICPNPPFYAEGIVLSGEARWQAMSEAWASRFPSTRGIPRGYLVLDNPDVIEIHEEVSATQIHPFTVMEYRSGAKELYDFVYATADTRAKTYRQSLEKFFNRYKTEQERYGRYLLAGDVMMPLWDSEFVSPADLRRADPSADSQLNLLEQRVRERMIGDDTLDKMLEALGSTCTGVDDVRRISKDLGIEPSTWLRGGSLAEVCSQFMDEVQRQGKLEPLVEVFALQYPTAVKESEA
jgi:hypothetical protein